jgi:hypothetical protein
VRCSPRTLTCTRLASKTFAKVGRHRTVACADPEYVASPAVPARAELSHAWRCHLVVCFPPRPFTQSESDISCRGLYLLYFRSGVRDSAAYRREVPHLVSWRHGCGPRPGAHVSRLSPYSEHKCMAAQSFWSVVVLMCSVHVNFLLAAFDRPAGSDIRVGQLPRWRRGLLGSRV